MDRVSSRHVTWTDIENPTEEEIGAMTKRLLIHPLAAQEMRVVTYRPKVEQYEEHLYLVLHFPVFEPSADFSISREIDFIIFPYNLITVHYDPVPQLDDFLELLASHEAIRERKFGTSAVQLLHNIISLLFTVSRKDFDNLEGRVRRLEEKVFSDQQESALRDIAVMKRDILNFQKALKPQRAVLESLELHGTQLFGLDTKPYFNDIKGEYVQLWDSVENLREILETLYDTNLSLLSATTNRIMKTLTIFTVILMPLSFIAFIYSMDIPWVPGRQNVNAFWVITCSMILISFGIWRIFKSHKWL